MRIVVKGKPPRPLTREEVESLEREMDELGVRELYDSHITDGTEPKAAALLASGCAPATWNTGDDFLRRENSRMRSMDNKQLEDIVAIAKKAGINTQGKTYNGALGKYNDPKAWVSDLSDIRKSAKSKGLSIKGMVNYQAPEKAPETPAPLAPDIVDRIETNKRKSNPDLDAKCRESKKVRKQLRKAIVEKHSRKPR